MNIIIVGDGKVGYTIAGYLTKEDHNITIIDKNEEALRKADDTLDVMCVKGNGARASILIEAGIEEADLVIAATSRDELNMLTCFMAKKVAENVKTIARIRDPEYYEEFTTLRHQMGVDMVINPEFTAAQEIANILQFPSAMNIEIFFGGKERLVEFKVMEGDLLVGAKLSKISSKIPQNMLFVAVERGGEAYIPNGDFEFRVNDRVYIMGQITGITNLFKMLGRYVEKINTVLMIGGGRTSYYLTKIISRLGMSVKIIEIDSKKCLHLADTVEEAIIIEGDGTNQDVLDSENLEEIDAFIAMTGRDEENLITAMYAVEKGVDKVIAMTTRMNLPNVINKLGLDSIIDPKIITASYITGYVRGMQNTKGSIVEALYKIMDGKVEVISFIANETTSFLNIPIKNLSLKKELVIACILHRSVVTIPHGNESITVGDKVLVVTKNHHIIKDLNDILE
ncbi:trk system potassium uptake protein TrkA [Mobilisporobacter senegalensis]|uniref:Trk system potassium uptake protein TrkA n=1 Tax=Mobilisporobacter senegalensis TaxID=1329262 RepID=A0A3N1XUR6_9FIRM|nr:Trk system potassium transporter TrkA [Mobilisporobacter senegalensis]ROR30359.1 trk system potassium uptake protein TrkA [Mobilisporobacter senegalensis]